MAFKKITDAHRKAITKHGGYSGGKEKYLHYIWRTMRDRCTNPTHAQYKYYGAKGITVCERWQEYENFVEDMGERPNKEYSLDRIDNRLGYFPSNCKWSTRSEQQKNKNTTRRYTNGSFTGTLVECAKHLGISKESAHWRYKNWATFSRGEAWQELQKNA
jgi:hypothetical protein